MLTPKGRVVMVSGANRGIGRAISEALYAAGYSLSLGARDVAALNDLTENWESDRIVLERYDAEDQG